MDKDSCDLVAEFTIGCVADAIALRQANSVWRLAVDGAARRVVAEDQPELAPSSSDPTNEEIGLRASLTITPSEVPGPRRSAVCRAFGCGRGNAWRSVTRLIILAFGVDASARPNEPEMACCGRRPLVLKEGDNCHARHSAKENADPHFAWVCQRPAAAHNVAAIRRLLSDLRSVLVRFRFAVTDVSLPPPLTSPGAFGLLRELRLESVPVGNSLPAASSSRTAAAAMASYRALLRSLGPQLKTLALVDTPTEICDALASVHEFPAVTEFTFSTPDDAAAAGLLAELCGSSSARLMPQLAELSWTAPLSWTDSIHTAVATRPSLSRLTLRRHAMVPSTQAAAAVDAVDRVAAHQLAADRPTASRLRILDLATPYPVAGFPVLECVHVRLHDLPPAGWWAPGDGPGAAATSVTMTLDSFVPRGTSLTRLFPSMTALSLCDDGGESMLSMAPTDRHFARLEARLPSSLTSIDVADIPELDERILTSFVADADVPTVATIRASTRLLRPILRRFGPTLQHLDLRGDYRATTHVGSDVLGDDFALPNAISVRIPILADACAFVREGRSRFPKLELLSLRCLGPVTASALRMACPRLFTIEAAVTSQPPARA